MSLPLLSSTPSWVLRGAYVDLDFAGSRYFQQGYGGGIGSLISCSRASTAYIDDLSGTWTAIASNLPRISNRGLLVEEARTNNAINNVSLSSWTLGSNSSTTTGQTSPDSGTSAALLTENSSGGFHSIINNNALTSGTNTYTFSVFVKPNGRTWFFLSNIPAASFAYFNAAGSGTVGTSGSGGSDTFVSAGITAYANGWYRAYIVTTFTSSVALHPVIGLASADNTGSYTGNGISGMYLWLPDQEQGTFPTSPIVNATAGGVTRAADVVTLTNVPVFGSAYTLFAQGAPNAPTAYPNNQNILEVSNGGTTQRLVQRRNGATGALLTSLVGGTGAGFAPTATWAQITSGKIISAVTAGDQASVFNGGTPGTASAATLPATPTAVFIGANSLSTEFWNGYISRIALWPTTRLPNATLIVLTT